ncbi:hypothetical protein B0O80DRAFT_442510 [Mortierella sp. GBAus27b]|nr:hypothetical protein B0O80DRAFT_442510 [Mortierella sp. GBAus27b]
MKTREARMVRKQWQTSIEHNEKDKLKAPAKRTSSKHQPKDTPKAPAKGHTQSTSQKDTLKAPTKRTHPKHQLYHLPVVRGTRD